MSPVSHEAPSGASNARTQRDHGVVVVLLLVAVVVVFLLSTISVRATMRQDAVRQP